MYNCHVVQWWTLANATWQNRQWLETPTNMVTLGGPKLHSMTSIGLFVAPSNKYICNAQMQPDFCDHAAILM